MSRYPAAYRPGAKDYGAEPSGRSKDARKSFLGPPPAPVAPPPVLPPPIAGAASAAAGGAGAAAAIGLGLGVGGGLVLGYAVKKLIDDELKKPRFVYHTPISEEELISLYAEEAPAWMDFQGAGWTLVCTTSPCDGQPTSPPDRQLDLTTGSDCISQCIGSNVTGLYPHSVGATVVRVVTGQRRVNALGNDRFASYQTWLRSPSTLPNPYVPARAPVYLPPVPWHWGDWWFPEESPIHKPKAPAPARQPWRKPSPVEQPTNPEAKPQPKKHPSPVRSPSPTPWPLTPEHFPWPITIIPAPIRLRPGIIVVPTVPDIVITPGPGVFPRPSPAPLPGPHPGPDPGPAPPPAPSPATGGVGVAFRPPRLQNKPPPEGTKERKLNIRTVAGRVWIAINFATEALDFVEALWEAIPKRYRSKPKWYGGRYHPVSTRRKMQDVYDHFEKIELAQATENLINNQFEDWFYGLQGKAIGRATGNLGISTGLNRALRSAQKQSGVEVKLPEIHYDEVTGEIWIDMGSVGGTLPIS